MERVGYVGLFFFQAEDGIRDATVTGVQTCALPISCGPLGGRPARTARRHASWREVGTWPSPQAASRSSTSTARSAKPRSLIARSRTCSSTDGESAARSESRNARLAAGSWSGPPGLPISLHPLWGYRNAAVPGGAEFSLAAISSPSWADSAAVVRTLLLYGLCRWVALPRYASGMVSAAPKQK